MSFQKFIIFSFLIHKIISYYYCPPGYYGREVWNCKECPKNSVPTTNTSIYYSGCKCNEENTSFDKINWKCKKCPEDSDYDNIEDFCRCKNSSKFFNLINWKCESCPEGQSPSEYENSCSCNGDKIKNDFKNECYNCPSDSNYEYGYCNCIDPMKKYDIKQNLCVPLINTVKDQNFSWYICKEGYGIYNETACLPCPNGSISSGNGDCTCNRQNEYFSQFKCIKNMDYNCPKEQFLHFFSQKCVNCPDDSSIANDFDEVINKQYCNCADGKIFDYRNKKCINCGENDAKLKMECKKCPIGSYSDGISSTCYCENGIWDSFTENCVNEKGEIIENDARKSNSGK